MSKVKIQGNASGSGVLTISAPNTSTDRTITLPDSTGTLLTTTGSGANLTGVGVDGISSSADATAMTITSDEDIGVGTASPSSRLHVYDGAGANIAIQSSAGSHWRIGDAVGASNGQLVIRDHTNSANRITILADGKVQTAQGILFGSDTAAANTLEDYEEGTWTPSLQIAPSGVTMGTIWSATYTKIGNRVHLTLACNLNSSSSPAPNTDLRMTGFPFPFADSGDLFNATLHANYKATPQLFMNGGRYFYFQTATVGGNNQSSMGGGLDSVSTLGLCMTYRTTS